MPNGLRSIRFGRSTALLTVGLLLASGSIASATEPAMSTLTTSANTPSTDSDPCASDTLAAEPSPTPSPTSSPSPTSEPAPSGEPAEDASPSASPSTSESPTPDPSAEPTETPTASPSATPESEESTAVTSRMGSTATGSSSTCDDESLRTEAVTTHVVTSTADSGSGTLREAITTANSSSGDAISFSLPNPSTITLSSSLPQITKPMTITGPGADQLTIDAGGTNRVFYINTAGTGTVISDLTLTGSTSTDGNNGALVHNTKSTSEIRRVSFTNNAGARLVYNKEANSYLTIDDCTFSDNTGGRLLHNDHGSPNNVTVTSSTFSNNASVAVVAYRFMSITDSTFTGNRQALDLRGNGNTVFSGNTVSDNSAGIYMWINSGYAGTVTNNLIQRNTPGLYLSVPSDDDITITGNTFEGNSPNLNYNGSTTVPSFIESTNTFITPTASPELAPSTLSFDTTTVGSTSTSVTATLSNTGAADMEIDTDGITVAGDDSTDFSVTGGTCASGATVSASGSCTVTMTFTPSAHGARTASLSVATDAGTVTASLRGTGAASSSSSGSGSSGTENLTPAPIRTTPPSRVTLPLGAVLGAGLMVIDGRTVPVSPQRSTSGGRWTVSGDDFSLEFQPTIAPSGLIEAPDTTVQVPNGGQLNVSGDGYLASSEVAVYLVPPELIGLSARTSEESVYLGDAPVGSDGTFAATFTVPGTTDTGDYILQVNGWAQDSELRSVNLGLEVFTPQTEASVSRAAFFQGRSAEFSKNGRRKLRSLIEALPNARDDLRIDITAVSVGLGTSAKDSRLATKRGRALQTFLADKGVEGTYVIDPQTGVESRQGDQKMAPAMSSRGKPLSTVRISYSVPN